METGVQDANVKLLPYDIYGQDSSVKQKDLLNYINNILQTT